MVKICEVVDGCEDCPKYGDDCDGDKMAEHTDLISRADAICEVLVNDGIDNIVDRINALPSADAEWILCSERLPSESDDYICTIPLDANETYTEVLTFHKGRFYEDDDEWGATYHDDVLAWMPLPKPYREESEVEE